MKYVKILGLLAVAATALMAFAGTASATELTSPAGTKVGVGTIIHGTSEGTTSLTGTITISCAHSTMEGEVTNAGGTGATVSGPIKTLTFSNCGNHTVTVLKPGTLEVHSLGSNTGTLTSSGAEITVLLHSFLLGTVHCIYVTSNTDIGNLTGSNHSGSPTATFTATSQSIPRKTTDGACGEHATWEGSYEITKPDPLFID